MAQMDRVLLEAQSQAQGRLRRGHWQRQVGVTALCVLLGLLLVAQLRTQQAISRTPLAAARSDPLLVVSTLIEGNLRLRQEQADLTRQIEEYRWASGRERLTTLVAELNRLRLANGLVEVTGPGIEVRIEGPISPLEMQDLVNELRNVGAEALGLNGQRLIVSSVIASQGTELAVNGVPLAPPYVLSAIGEPQTMETALLRQGGLLMALARGHEGLRFAVAQRERLVLPVFARTLQFRYATPVE